MQGALVVVVAVGTCVLTAACSASSGSATPPTSPGTSVRVLTLAPETTTPIGQAVALTLASRDQEAGKITLAVSGFNLTNTLSVNTQGFSGVSGRIGWDPALLEPDGLDSGDFLRQGGASVSCCRQSTAAAEAIPGTYPFLVVRGDETRLMGSGELFLIRLKPVQGVTSGTSTIRFIEEVQNRGGFPFTAAVVLSPFNPGRGSTVEHVYGGTVTIR